MKGIDVSDNQGLIDWAKAKAHGVEFVIHRSTRGSGNPDKYLPTNIQGCLDNDIPFDFYKYSYATTNAKAKSEAKRVVEVLQGYGIQPGGTVIWMDVEDKCQFALSKKELTTIVDLWKEIIVNSGYQFGLYMGKYGYNNEIDATQFNDDIWLARYYAADRKFVLAENPAPAYRPEVKSGRLWGWQYTSKGVVNGIKGNVDLDEIYYQIETTEVLEEYYKSPEFTIVDGLNKIGVDSSYNNRKIIAKNNGIDGYKGTAEQNILLFEMLCEGKLKR